MVGIVAGFHSECFNNSHLPLNLNHHHITTALLFQQLWTPPIKAGSPLAARYVFSAISLTTCRRNMSEVRLSQTESVHLLCSNSTPRQGQPHISVSLETNYNQSRSSACGEGNRGLNLSGKEHLNMQPLTYLNSRWDRQPANAAEHGTPNYNSSVQSYSIMNQDDAKLSEFQAHLRLLDQTLMRKMDVAASTGGRVTR